MGDAVVVGDVDAAMRGETVRVSEVFGPTFQGEGRWAGRLATFVRLAGCNLDCRWCDTPYSWDWFGHNGTRFDPRVEVRRVSPHALADEVSTRLPYGAHLVVTGGEPLAQQAAVEVFLDRLGAMVEVEVETNGTILPSDWLLDVGVDHWNVSPKLPSAEVSNAAAVRGMDALRLFADRPNADFKFVVADERDVEAMDALRGDLLLPGNRCWLMACGATAAEHDARFPWVAQRALERGVNLSGRLHLHAFGGRRGA